MRPEVRAVLGHIDGKVAHELDPVFASIGVEARPLPEEEALHALPETHFASELAAGGGKVLGNAHAQPRLPRRERGAAMVALDCHEERIIVEPCALALAKCPKFVGALALKALHRAAKHVEAALVERPVINARRVIAPEAPLVLARLEQALLCQIVKIDEIGIACKRREGLIRGIAVARRSDWQQLPDRLARGREEVHERARLGAERTNAPRRGQGGHGHQDAGTPHTTPLLSLT